MTPSSSLAGRVRVKSLPLPPGEGGAAKREPDRAKPRVKPGEG